MTHIMLKPATTMNERSDEFARIEMFKSGIAEFIEGCLLQACNTNPPMFDVERHGNIITVTSPMGFKFNIMPMYMGKKND